MVAYTRLFSKWFQGEKTTNLSKIHSALVQMLYGEKVNKCYNIKDDAMECIKISSNTLFGTYWWGNATNHRKDTA